MCQMTKICSSISMVLLNLWRKFLCGEENVLLLSGRLFVHRLSRSTKMKIQHVFIFHLNDINFNILSIVRLNLSCASPCLVSRGLITHLSIQKVMIMTDKQPERLQHNGVNTARQVLSGHNCCKESIVTPIECPSV